MQSRTPSPLRSASLTTSLAKQTTRFTRFRDAPDRDTDGLSADHRLGGHSVETLLPTPPEVEPDIRHVLDAIFQDLQYIDCSEADLVSAYLDGIERPLEIVRRLGFQLAATTTKGKLTWPAGILGQEEPTELAVTKATYFLAPRPCFYRPAGDDHVHVLGVDCDGERGLTREDARVRSWGSRQVVERNFEGTVPWCDTCFLHLPAELQPGTAP